MPDQEVSDNANQFDVRLDQALGSVSRMFVRYSWQGRRQLREGLFDAPGLGGLAFVSEALDRKPKAWSVAGGITHVLSGTKLNEIRVGYTVNKSSQDTPVHGALFDGTASRGFLKPPRWMASRA